MTKLLVRAITSNKKLLEVRITSICLLRKNRLAHFDRLREFRVNTLVESGSVSLSDCESRDLPPGKKALKLAAQQPNFKRTPCAVQQSAVWPQVQQFRRLGGRLHNAAKHEDGNGMGPITGRLKHLFKSEDAMMTYRQVEI